MPDTENFGLEFCQAVMRGDRRISFHDLLGIVFTDVAVGRVEAECYLDKERHGNDSPDRAHGGLILAFADAVGGFTFVTTMDRKGYPVMSTISHNFIGGAHFDRTEPLRATGQILNHTKSTGLIQVNVTQGSHLIGHTIGRAVIIKPENG